MLNGVAEHAIEIDVPNDPINEQVVLAAMCADDGVRRDLAGKLREEHFHAEEHREIFAALKALEDRGLSFDPAALHRLAPDIDVRIVEKLVAARPDVPDNLAHYVDLLRWDATRAAAAKGPLDAFLTAFQDPKESPAKLRSLAKQLAESFEGGPGGGSAFAFRSAAEIAKKRKPIPLVIPQFGIGPGRPTLITAYAGTGKTMLVQELLLAVAADKKYCWGGTTKIAQHGPVLHIDYEMGPDLLDDRFQRLAWSRKIKLAKLGDRLRSVSYPRLYLSSDAAEVEEAFTIATRGHVLCSIDNFGAATPHAPRGLNDAGVRIYLDVISRVSQRTGCSFVVQTHDGKGGGGEGGRRSNGGGQGASLQRMRNSSAIADAAGNVLSITPTKDGALRIEQTKSSLRTKGAPVCVRIVDEGDEVIDPVNKCLARPGIAIRKVEETEREDDDGDGPSGLVIRRAKDALCATLKDHDDGIGPTELVRITKGNKAAKLAALKELREAGVVVAKEGTRLLVLRDAASGKDDQDASQPF